MKPTRTCLAVLLSTTALFSSASSYAVDTMPLHTIQTQVYHVSFSGDVSVQGRAKAGAQVRAEIKLAEQSVVETTGLTDAQGHFTLTLSFEGTPSEQMDWALTAEANRLNSPSVEGRQILSEVSTVAIRTALEFTEDGYRLALR